MDWLLKMIRFLEDVRLYTSSAVNIPLKILCCGDVLNIVSSFSGVSYIPENTIVVVIGGLTSVPKLFNWILNIGNFTVSLLI